MAASGRARRTTQLGGLVGSEAAKQAAVRTTNMARSKAKGQAALRERNAKLADRLVTVLGGMRGGAMKFGQMLSMMDGGIIPADQREEFQRKLAELHANAVAMAWEPEMRVHLESELGMPVSTAFARFDPEPVAAASIGQVYRARMHDGRDVAVKVQYPGIEAMALADISTIRVLLTMYRMLHPALDTTAMADEIEGCLREELDYRIEARNTRMIARSYRGHPFIRIPEVVDSLSSQRVLVTEWIDGRPLNAAFGELQAERNRVAEIVFRFYGSTASRLRIYNGDPHPGNVLLRPDGSVCFLDFGLVKQIDTGTAESELAIARAAIDGDKARVAEILRARGAVPGSRTPAAATYRTYLSSLGWYLREGEFAITPETVNKMLTESSAFGGTASSAGRRHNLPAEYTLRMRAELQVAAVLGQLGARLNLRAIAREWLCDDEPATELGHRQREWENAFTTVIG
ncbi:AarF/ABC1/UbiB kinase family protein [Nocardia sp. NPDC051030]|uniref:ABC1 kinase family protein n=1 Tax=Nocardia sp. NPDC051030 TaxID=3155162 RepID=UPI003423FD45